jgi:hypothetical protein
MNSTSETQKSGNGRPCFLRGLLGRLPLALIAPLFLVGGVLAGLGGYTVYASRAFSYLADDPAACVNCHIMSSYYQAWSRSSHARWATCNDCHVPQDSAVSGYLFKANEARAAPSGWPFPQPSRKGWTASRWRAFSANIP